MTSQYTVLNSASDLDRSAVRIKPWQPNTCNISDTNSLYGQTAVKLSQYRKKQGGWSRCQSAKSVPTFDLKYGTSNER